MRASELELRDFIKTLREGRVPGAHSDAAADFAGRARKLGPHALVTEGMALCKKEEDPRPIARVVLDTLRGMLGDLEEHGEHSEFAGEGRFLRQAISSWTKRDGGDANDGVLLSDDLEEALVAFVEYAWLPPAQTREWKKLRASRRLVTAAATLAKKPVEPWFAELIAAYLGREATMIARGGRAESWQAKLEDLPKMLEVLRALGLPPVFSPRVLRAVTAAMWRHGHAPTREALAAMGALDGAKAEPEPEQRKRSPGARTKTAKAAKTKTAKTKTAKTKTAKVKTKVTPRKGATGRVRPAAHRGGKPAPARR